MAPCSTSRLDLAPERRNAFPHPNRPAAGQYVLDLRTRSFDVSCLVLCFFGLHLPLLLPLSDTLLASLLSLTFLSCQHSQALMRRLVSLTAMPIPRSILPRMPTRF